MSFKKVAITTGDVDGVGLEVTAKALNHLGPQVRTQFYLFRSPESPKFRTPGFQRVQTSDISEALAIQPQKNQLIEILQKSSPAQWVEDVAKSCLQKDFHSMVTAPLSKQEIQNSGFKDLGHTDILKRVSGRKFAFMTFVGPKFNVLLVSGHIPVEKIQNALTTELLKEAVTNALQARALLKPALSRRPLALLGLNPHAGDQGLIGDFEAQVLRPFLKSLPGKPPIVGPMVPDAAFLEENWKRFSFFVALYHDQGLIPFKMAHGFDVGAHLTLGLPIRRSSVDHGTAKDLFGKNRAKPGSMIEALRWGVRLAR
ncbi:MAG: 4-hydroxythreonine-4-phosphate dehydrogenase PdxA [Pseudobdellovibrionaceae bacterium]